MSSKCKGLSLLAVLLLMVALGSAPMAAQITYSNFNSVAGLALNGTAAQATSGNQQVLRLTPDVSAHVSGTAWFQTQQQSVAAGFTTTFQFQISHDPENGNGPADGLAFVIQNSSGDGFGTAALGGAGGSIGYGVGDSEDPGTAIPNSLAIEFDT